MSELRKVRTTMQPDVDLEVDDVEYVELHRQGVLLGNQSRDTEKPSASSPRTVKENS